MSGFGRRFRVLRQEKGLSIRQAAKGRWDIGNLSRVERGQLPPPLTKKTLTNYFTAINATREEREELTFLCRIYHVNRINREFGFEV